jgi:glutamate-5-semialdehyde dehydrogenase
MVTTARSQARRPLEETADRARAAGRELARMASGQKDAALFAVADALERRTDEIVRENALDVADAREAKTSDALVDRLILDDLRVAEMAAGVRAVAALPDPVGRVTDGRTLPNGLAVKKVQIPIGVIAVIYEGRPNVTSDAAALALKSGNAIILRGSSVAARSNRVVVDVMSGALAERGVPHGAVQLLGTDRAELERLVKMEDRIDVVIPRGGEGLKRFLGEHSRVPVIYAASGNCHVYVHADADLDMALDITVNAKVQRPGVCNAAETLLVHRDAAAEFLPRVAEALAERGVELRASADAKTLIGSAIEVLDATEEDFATEFLALTLAVGLVDSVAEAADHIARYGSGHSEAIVTRSLEAATQFERWVDSACVYVNASTRFTDGGEFGMGAEIGNSTQKLHVRGPIGLDALTTYKYVVHGSGQIR